MLLQEIISMLRRRVWLIVVFIVAGVLLSVFLSSRRPLIYQADAGVVVVQQNTQVKLEPRFQQTTGQGVNLTDRADSGLLTLASMVTNEAIADSVYRDISGEYADAVSSPTGLVRFISAVVENGIVRVRAQSTDPQFAATLANAWARRYADFVNRIYAGQATTLDFNTQVGDAKTRYEAAQADLVTYINQDETPRLTSEINDKQAMLDRLLQLKTDAIAGNLQKVYARRQRAVALLTDARVLEGLLTNSKSSVADAANTLAMLTLQFGAVDNSSDGSTTQASGLQFNYNPQRLGDISIGSAQLTADLENLISVLEARITDYDARIEELTTQAVSTQSDSDPRIQSLFTEINSLQAQVANLGSQKQELQRERDLLWDSYTLIANASEEVQLQASTSDGTLVRYAIPASVPRRPIQGSLSQTAIVGGFLGLVLSLAAIFFLEIIDTKVRTREDVEEVLKLPVLGITPRGDLTIEGKPVALAQPQSVMTEGIRFLRSSLETLPQHGRLLLFTSVSPNAGKTSVVANLAILSALAGQRILLIDANLRSPRLHTLFGLSNTQGLIDLLKGGAEQAHANLEESIQTTSVPGLSVLPAGNVDAQAPDWLARPEIDQLLSKARGLADLVFIDSSAAGPYPEATILARHVDGVILVVRSGATTVMEIQQLRHDVTAASELFGVVLTNVSGAKQRSDRRLTKLNLRRGGGQGAPSQPEPI